MCNANRVAYNDSYENRYKLYVLRFAFCPAAVSQQRTATNRALSPSQSSAERLRRGGKPLLILDSRFKILLLAM